MQLNFPALDEVLEELEFFERERTDRHVVEVAILLYGCGVSLRRVSQVLGWMGVERSHVAVWKWIQKFGQRLGRAGRRPAADLPAIYLLDETAISQYGEEFVLFEAVDPETRHILHAEVAPTRNYLTTWRFFEQVRELYGRVPPIVVTDGADYGPVFTRLGITRIVRLHSVRNRIERLDPGTQTSHRHVLRLLSRSWGRNHQQLVAAIRLDVERLPKLTVPVTATIVCQRGGCTDPRH